MNACGTMNQRRGKRRGREECERRVMAFVSEALVSMSLSEQ